MKVKVGDKIYDSENEPIMVILSDSDKENIKSMDKTSYKYCSFPEKMELSVAKNFMKLI